MVRTMNERNDGQNIVEIIRITYIRDSCIANYVIIFIE